MSIDRKESDGPPMFDLTKRPDAHTYHRSPDVMADDCMQSIRPAPPARVGDPVITILAEQSYANGCVAEARIRVDLYILLQSHHAGDMMHRAALEALAKIGVKL